MQLMYTRRLQIANPYHYAGGREIFVQKHPPLLRDNLKCLHVSTRFQILRIQLQDWGNRYPGDRTVVYTHLLSYASYDPGSAVIPLSCPCFSS